MRHSISILGGILTRCAAVVGAITVAAVAARAQTVVLTPTKDATLYENPTGLLANGQGSSLFVGRTDQNSDSIRRSCLHFDIAGSIPPGVTIDSVELTVDVTRVARSENRTSTLHRLLADWGEGASNASGEEGTGAPSAAGDASWIHTFFAAQNWTTAGGDFLAQPSASVTIRSSGFVTVGTTAALVADVQAWLDNPAANFGWIMLGDESTGQTAKRFASRESGASGPQLTVNYTVGVPDTVACRATRVNAGAGPATNVLSINGSFGDAAGIVQVAPGAPITIAMAASPSGPSPAPFAVYLDLGEPAPGSVTTLPRSLGLFCVNIPVNGGTPFKIWNNIGREARLGTPDFPSSPAPSILVAAPSGTSQMVTATLQGLLFDDGSSAQVPASVTNAVILRIQ